MTRVLWALLGAATWRAAQETTPSERRDFGGSWALNAELSDDMPLLPGEAMAAARASGTVRGGGRPTGSGFGPNHHQLVKVRTALRQALETAGLLKIADSGRRVILTDAAGSALAVLPDGRRRQLEQYGLRLELVAHWETPLLRIERRFEDGTLVSDRYATFANPRQLVATTTIQNDRTREPAVTMRRVYDEIPR